jgi:L-lactate dehydrogenase (cytochrome)
MGLAECINIEDLRSLARRRLPGPIFDFLEGGADDEWTARRNVEAFDNYPLIPRTLVDVGTIDTKTNLLGRQIDWPVIIAPSGISAIFHHTGEAAVSRATGESGTFYSLSTMSSQSIEEIAALDDVLKIFQVYVFRDRELIEALVERCRSAGYDALCLTVDTPLSGNRERDRANGMSIPPQWTLSNLLKFAARPVWSLNALFRGRYELANFRDITRNAARSAQTTLEFVNNQFDRTVTWKDAAWLAKEWSGPFALKGVMSADDARRAVDIGATAVWLSNHGGRQIDGVPATIDCLADIRDAVGDSIEIIFDGGVRRGTHILKALALGANVCAIGRPYLYGLAAGGYTGVAHALEILRSELERDMALIGCPSLDDIGRHTLADICQGVGERLEGHRPTP